MIAVLMLITSLPQIVPAVSELPQPVNITLTSINFIHLLTWESGPATPVDVYYQVMIITDTGTTWVPVAACQHVEFPLVCNMTEAFSDPSQVYITKVIAKLGAQASLPSTHPGFQPIKDTYLDLPLMAVTPCGQNLCVDLHPQMQHLRDFYESLCYQLRIKSSGAERAQETTSLKRVILKNLAPGRGYCISVRFFDSVVPRVSNYSQPQCAFTSSIYTSESLFVVVLCIVVIAGLIIVILLVNTGFLCLRRRPMPPALTSIPHTEEVLVFVPHKASLSPLFIQAPLHSPDEEMDGYKTHQFSNLLCASLPLPASFSEPLPSSSSNLYSMSFREEFYCPKPQVWIWNDASSNAASKHLTASRPSISDCLLKSDHGLLADEERLEPMEEENGGIGEMDNQSVNLNTLILGRLAEEEEEKSLSEQSGVDCFAQQEHENLPVTPSEDSFETIDEDEHFVYMTRPSSSDL
ncbi:cytokine receptor family member b2 isoform X1 [Dunckerocampus dactyliophorus]|uniref:cytokine receptor family member b2 isoform X1 n=1 Tax=Dunckerocampus dactyliophorus TaxID=161453 RepID=UPI002405FC4D|nr:cytokine receptor family member b2 isoform X1 [Dunckerocampus dactyliophorus]XP_054643444.1 cytokine receptor family member b2 isoform X1 [Dunckerocampus dactyliophorus]